MHPTERQLLQQLDAAVARTDARAAIDGIAGRLLNELDDDASTPLVWSPVPLDVYGELPGSIRSSWVFVLRRNCTSGAERHPNSCQRVMSLVGSADLQTWENGDWSSNVLLSDADAPLERRWLFIPADVWHKPVMGDTHWTVVSFHTVEAEELIEERPRGALDEPGTTQRRYLES